MIIKSYIHKIECIESIDGMEFLDFVKQVKEILGHDLPLPELLTFMKGVIKKANDVYVLQQLRAGMKDDENTIRKLQQELLTKKPIAHNVKTIDKNGIEWQSEYEDKE